MCDNYFQNCPPKMGGFREITDYQTNAFTNELMKQKLNIVRDDQYRVYLQTHGQQILDNTWNYFKDNYSCWNNQCIFTNPRTMVNPIVFPAEMKRWNGLMDNTNIYYYPCETKPDYRLNRCYNTIEPVKNQCQCCKHNIQYSFKNPAPILKVNNSK